MTTLTAATPRRPNPTPKHRVIEAIRTGAPETAAWAVLRRHQLPRSEQVQNDDLFDVELAGLVPSRSSPVLEPVVEPAADLAADPADEAPVAPAPVEPELKGESVVVEPVEPTVGAATKGRRNGHRVVSVAPPGSPLAPSSKIKPEQLGKTPSRRLENGTWAGYGWQGHEPSEAEVRAWDAAEANIGILGDYTPAIDFDSSDAAVVQRALAVVASIAGRGPVRTRSNSPKLAVAYRMEGEPFARMAVTITDPAGASHLIEILGAKRQWLVYGTHPSGARYEWDGTPLYEIPHADLPPLSFEKADAVLEGLIAEFSREPGWRAVRVGTGRLASGSTVEEADHAPSLAALQDVVAGIPNDDTVDRAELVHRGYAIKSAGANWPAEAFEIFDDYCGRWTEGVNSAEWIRDTWDSLTPSNALGWSYLLARSTQAAKYEFEALEEPQIAPLPTEAQRLAALTKDAEAAFLQEASTLAGTDLLTLWETLVTASTALDPLGEVFGQLVFPAAVRAPLVTDAAFRFAIHNSLVNEPRWVRLTAGEKSLLLRAALALLQKADRRIDQRTPTPIHDLPPRAYVVDHLVPRDALIALVGAPGQGKSWLALDLGLLVARETDATFAGLKVNAHGPVWYFASEDEHGLHERRRAAEAASGAAPNLHLFSSVPLLSGSLAEVFRFCRDAAQHGGAPILIVIDVFTDTVVGDENAVQIIGPAMRRAKIIGQLTGATVLLVHHASKARPEDGRGSSAFTGALDVIGAVTSDDRGIRLKITKHRSAPTGKELRFHLRDGVLQPGPDPRAGDPLLGGSGQRDQDARRVAEVLRDIASVDHPATRTDLTQAIAATCLGMNAQNRSTTSSRRSRAIQRALQLQWVSVSGKAGYRMYVPGPVTPPPEAASLEDVL